MSAEQHTLSFVGDLTVDRYTDLKETHLGGSSLNCAMWAKRLGAEVSILAAVGEDKSGRDYFSTFQQEGIQSGFVDVLPGNTSNIEIFTDASGERSWGAWIAGVLEQFHLRKDAVLFLQTQDAAALVIYDKTVHLLEEFTGSWKKKSDQKPLRAVDFDDLSQFGRTVEIVRRHTDGIDVAKLGLNKGSDASLINELKQLAQQHPHIAILITLGKAGSMVFKGNKEYYQDADNVHVVDTTGAGDAFLAGYLVTFLQTHDIQESLRQGTTLASQVIQKIGAY